MACGQAAIYCGLVNVVTEPTLRTHTQLTLWKEASLGVREAFSLHFISADFLEVSDIYIFVFIFTKRDEDC